MDETFFCAECNRIPTRYSYEKLKLSHHKINQNKDSIALSYISASLNAFKHNTKEYYFRKGN